MFVLENGDKIQGHASAATVVDYHISGLTGSTLKNLSDGQLPLTIGDLYTSAATDLAKTIVLTNTDSVARTINLYHTPSGGTARRILPKDMSLEAGGSILFDGESVSILSASGGVVGSVANISAYQLIVAEGAFVDGDKTKLDGIATAATANATNADLRARSSHTGTQLASTVSNFEAAVTANASVAANTAKVTNATHTGDATGNTALTIANNAVTLGKMATMSTASLLGRNTGGTGNPEVLSAATARTLLNIEDGADVTDAANVTSAGAEMVATFSLSALLKTQVFS